MTTIEEQLPDTQISVKYLAPEDIHVAASLLYQAYHEDPLLINILDEPNASKFESKLRALIREELSSFSKAGQPIIGVYIADNLVAVACVFISQSEIDASRGWNWRLRLMMAAGRLQTQQLLEKERTIKSKLSEYESYYFLSFIAVDPHYQGLGYGHHLLCALDTLINENHEASGLAVFVTKGNQVNFFEAHGYQLIEQLVFKSASGELLFKHRTDKLEKAL
ncbi:GNAT family acetyltransferase [Pseudoalteromonas luteoviolacea]|uniref:GNAT family acetyltransferase n=1 Tax=Pseudoalteromonas luteoviolacea TaxID=43657 RepID=A0A1C0TJL6_9GAMM|nr:GNAT family N-acetyltransferase [Pseudoalteromonas luteoviolacea]MBQ4814323.1 GNAT family N-acetyltransferase [Pseudoalteromonas luteoviolacea]OCQ18430.1 GNAT family acetyltransferase [Pseudoalteromonas luteoviolacea]